MYRASVIAKYIIRHCRELGSSISNLKLQKVLYFVQAEFLVDTDDPCFAETIYAWDIGPVVIEVYREYKAYGGANIPVIEEELPSIPVKDIERINAIVESTLHYTNAQLTDITHLQTPWLKAYERKQNNPISLDSLKEYFTEPDKEKTCRKRKNSDT